MNRVEKKKKKKWARGGVACWWDAMNPSKAALMTYNVRNSKSYIMSYSIYHGKLAATQHKEAKHGA
jgi:hypothetical protein